MFWHNPDLLEIVRSLANLFSKLSAAALVVVIVVGYVSSRLLAASNSAITGRRREGGRRFFWRTAALLVIALAIFCVSQEPSIVNRIYAVRKSKVRTAPVWVNSRSGFYYCPGTKAYGKLPPGRFMTESEALQEGYRPIERELCH